MWYMYTMEYYSAIKRNETGSFVETWLDLESVIQSEVSQKEITKHHILVHMCGIQEYGTDDLQNRNRDTDVENKCMDINGVPMDTMYKIDN